MENTDKEKQTEKRSFISKAGEFIAECIPEFIGDLIASLFS